MNDQQHETTAVSSDLSSLVIPLLKGVIYRGEASKSNTDQWNNLLGLQARVRDYVAVLGLNLVLDEAEGYAFLRSHECDEVNAAMPRLIARRPLTFPVSLLRVDAHINKVVELGFLRRLRTSGQDSSFEVRRIRKSFVDAQWLAEVDARLMEYHEQLIGVVPESPDE